VAEALLALAVAVAEEASRLLVDRLGAAGRDVGTKTTGTDMVTDVDRASEHLIVERLLAARPGDGVVAEEGSAHAGRSGILWVVDPLDGTTNYLYGHPGFAVSVAAEDEHGPLVGVVVDPLHGDVFAAVRGEGARRNGRAVRCTTKADLPTALVGTGFSYDAARRARQADVLRHVLPRVRDIRRGGAASVDLSWVACGRLDAFYERGLQPWDLAAGGLIAREAGAHTGDLDGGEASGAFVLAAAPALFDALLTLLADAGAGAA
jgi:myo-inositol-1(or 4)-monophosphatase